MPWTLTQSLSTGDLDTGGPYTHVIISNVTMRMKTGLVIVTLEYGKWDGSTWTPGRAPAGAQTSFTLSADDFAAVKTALNNIDQQLLNYAENQSLIPAGSFVSMP